MRAGAGGGGEKVLPPPPSSEPEGRAFGDRGPGEGSLYAGVLCVRVAFLVFLLFAVSLSVDHPQPAHTLHSPTHSASTSSAPFTFIFPLHLDVHLIPILQRHTLTLTLIAARNP